MASYIVALLLVIEMVITFGYCIREVASGVAVIGFLSFLFVAIFLWREKKLNLLKAKSTLRIVSFVNLVIESRVIGRGLC